jgi:hypothetical protein
VVRDPSFFRRENEAMMSAVSQLQHPAQPATTHITTSTKRGFDLIAAATVIDDLAGGIDY